MSGIANVLGNTPWWVFGLLALLTWLGLQALRDRTVPVWRLLATPMIFITWGVVSLVMQSLSSPFLIADWLTMAAIAGGIALVTRRLDNVRIDRTRQFVAVTGSTFPIFRNLLIFSAKYGLGVAVATAPAFASEFAIADVAVSGLAAGYFLAWIVQFASIYRRAADPMAALVQQ